MTAFFLMLPAADDILLLTVIFAVLVMSAYAGRLICLKHLQEYRAESTVITSATLTLSGLLIGFVFSVSINGYSAREQAQVREAQAAEEAWQYTSLLPTPVQQKARLLLKKYLDERIHFFRDDTTAGGRGWARMAEENQRLLWQLIVPEASHNPSSVMSSVLSVYNELLASQHQTGAIWKRQIPDAAWIVLIMFAASACFLIGYQLQERRGRGSVIYFLILPVLTSMVLFMIAEIDIPGQGIIRVTPDDLERLAESFSSENRADYYDLSHPIHHIG